MISIVCWMWNGPLRTFLPRHVNALQRMVAAHLPEPHRFICVCDSKDGLSDSVEWLETPAAAKAVGLLNTPEGPRFPSCYRRLWSFSKEAAVLGERILVIDIDLLVMRQMSHVVDIQAEFMGWRPYRDWGARVRFGGGIYLLQTGKRSHVWEDFKGQASINLARQHGFRGSDQAWISFKLAQGKELYWGKDAGLYSVRDLDSRQTLPPDACIVQFNGNAKPWHTNIDWARFQWSKFDPRASTPPKPPPLLNPSTRKITTPALGSVLGSSKHKMPL